MQKLKDFIVNDYETREDIAVSSLPNGDQLYQDLIKYVLFEF